MSLPSKNVDSVVLAFRVVLAALFVAAALGKVLDLTGARKALMNFGVSPQLAGSVAPVLPLAEFATAVGLVLTPTARVGAIAALLLMLAFTGAILRVLTRGQRPECHCFGIFYSAPAGWDTVGRNGAVAALAAFTVAAGPGPSLAAWVSARTAAQLVAIGLGVIAAGLATWVFRTRRDMVSLRRELRAAEAALDAVPPGLPVNALAPEFALEEARGGTLSLTELRNRGLPVLLIFAGRGCMFSWELEMGLARWQRTLSDRLTVALASHGGPQENQWQSQTLGIDNVLLQPNYELFKTYRVRATPSAVVISPEGRIGSNLAQGQPAVEALVRVTLRQLPRPASKGRPAAPALIR